MGTPLNHIQEISEWKIMIRNSEDSLLIKSMSKYLYKTNNKDSIKWSANGGLVYLPTLNKHLSKNVSYVNHTDLVQA